MSAVRCCVHPIILFSLCAVLLSTVSCKKPGHDVTGTDESQDHTAPLAVTDLTVTRMTPTGVHLCWSATGDDLDTGTAATYDLRYLRREITAASWDSAVVVSGLSAPSAAHAMDSVVVSGLLQDSTYYFAMKVGDEAGNWSVLSNVVQAICFDDYAVSFPDTAFEGVVRFYAGKPEGEIHRSDLLMVHHIATRNQRVHDLGGIEHCRNLYLLDFWGNQVADLTPLSQVFSLRVLKVGYNGLSDISPLSSLHDLDTLHLRANQIEDVAALSELDHLIKLDLSTNRISNTAPLTGKTTIRDLDLSSNQIVFTNPLYDLTGLDKLCLSNNLIDDLLPLAYNSGLADGDTLWLDGNPLAAPTTDSLIGVIRARGVAVIR